MTQGAIGTAIKIPGLQGNLVSGKHVGSHSKRAQVGTSTDPTTCTGQGNG